MGGTCLAHRSRDYANFTFSNGAPKLQTHDPHQFAHSLVCVVCTQTDGVTTCSEVPAVRCRCVNLGEVLEGRACLDAK